MLSTPYSESSLRSSLGHDAQLPTILRGLVELELLGISNETAASWIQSIENASAKNAGPDLVWSGPEVPGLHARDTRRVYEEVLGSASHSIWASTYAFFDGPKAFEVLAKRMDEVPDLEVTLLLNIQRLKGNQTKADDVVLKFAERFWKKDWPGKTKPRVFYDPRSLDLESKSSVLHAKAVVKDEEVVFVTSANFTEAALDRNIELGLLLTDRALALSINSHFRVLIEKKLLLPLPMV